ncbi:MAG: helix-turn-helix domain-containing protein [Chloroflexi bacterium]|nr:helix-turn-helix domain-containing protein [Chloroflexota bacterium]
MTTEQAATLMGLSTRHTRRILAAYSEKGAAAIAYGNRGRRPANATPSTLAIEVVRLARTQYAGVNHTHLSELLRERESIDIGRDTLRRILSNAGVSSPRRRRPPKHRVRRQRMPRNGMLIQVDGSYHRWLGKDGPRFTLLLAIDDATGTVVNALFCELENTRSYFLLLDGLVRRCGIPLALYSDRHAVFKHTPSPETAAAPPSSVERWTSLGYS